MGLSFVTPWLLWTLPLAVLPVILHYRSRQRERSMDFPGAFFLFHPARPMAGKNDKLEDLLLLVLRCALLALAFLALAGPQLNRNSVLPAPQLGGVGGEGSNLGREAWVLVLDDSPSLSCALDESRKPRFPGWVKTACEQLARYPHRQVAVETSSGLSLEFAEASLLSKRVPELLRANPCISGDRAAALERARRRLQEQDAPRKGILLLTDGLPNAAEGQKNELEARYRSALNPTSTEKIPLVLWDVYTLPVLQWSVQVMPAPRAFPVQGEIAWVEFSVHAQRGSGTRTLKIETAPILRGTRGEPRLGARTRPYEAPITLDAGGQYPVRIPLSLEKPGAIWVRAKLDPPDERAYDDQVETIVQAAPRREVWLWDARKTPERTHLNALRTALDPYKESQSGRVTIKVVGNNEGQESPEKCLNQSRPGALLVLLHDPEGLNLDPETAERLDGAVRQGLVVLTLPDFSKQSTSIIASNGRALAAGPLYPRALEGVEVFKRSSFEKPKPGELDGWALHAEQTPERTFSLDELFKENRNGELNAVRVSARLRLAQGGKENADAVLMRFEDQAPAVVLKRVGDGLWLQGAFGLEGSSAGIARSACWPVMLARWIEACALDRAYMDAPPVLALEKSWSEWGVPARSKARSISLDGPWDFQREPWVGLDPELIPESQTWSEELPAQRAAWTTPTLPWPGWYRFQDGVNEAWSPARINAVESGIERVPLAIREQLERAVRESGGAYIKGSEQAEEISRTLLSLQPGRSLSPLVWLCFGLAMLVELIMLAWRGRTA